MSATKICVTIDCEEQMFDFARQWAFRLFEERLLLLYGDLGAGKTTFVKGLVEALEIGSCDEVQSPTFTLLNIYQSESKCLYHFDLYRLNDPKEFERLGFDEYLFSPGLCCIEWPQKASVLSELKAAKLTITHLALGRRQLDLELTKQDSV